MLQDFIMDGPRVDYKIHQGFLVISTNPHTNTPEKRVTFPIRDYVEKKVTEIEERYRWIDEFY